MESIGLHKPHEIPDKSLTMLLNECLTVMNNEFPRSYFICLDIL